MVIEPNDKERDYLAAVIGGTPGLEFLGAYSSQDKAMACIGKDPPDLVVVDTDPLGGLVEEWLWALRGQLPRTPVLVLSSNTTQEALVRTLEAGVQGWLEKPCSPAQVVDTLLLLHQGGSMLSSGACRTVLDFFGARGAVARCLSVREKEILLHLCRGTPPVDIAARMGISKNTVRTHISGVLRKLEVNSRADALAKYLNPSQPTGRDL